MSHIWSVIKQHQGADSATDVKFVGLCVCVCVCVCLLPIKSSLLLASENISIMVRVSDGVIRVLIVTLTSSHSVSLSM